MNYDKKEQEFIDFLEQLPKEESSVKPKLDENLFNKFFGFEEYPGIRLSINTLLSSLWIKLTDDEYNHIFLKKPKPNGEVYKFEDFDINGIIAVNLKIIMHTRFENMKNEEGRATGDYSFLDFDKLNQRFLAKADELEKQKISKQEAVEKLAFSIKRLIKSGMKIDDVVEELNKEGLDIKPSTLKSYLTAAKKTGKINPVEIEPSAKPKGKRKGKKPSIEPINVSVNKLPLENEKQVEQENNDGLNTVEQDKNTQDNP